jgi:putative transposase
MRADDVTDTLEQALAASQAAIMLRHVAQAAPAQRQRRFSYIAAELTGMARSAQGMSIFAGAPLHPQTQGKIERWHQTLKNRILLENYFLPGDLERRSRPSSSTTITIATTRASNNLTPADAYFGRAAAIIKQRERIKRQTIEHRRLQHRKLAA